MAVTLMLFARQPKARTSARVKQDLKEMENTVKVTCFSLCWLVWFTWVGNHRDLIFCRGDMFGLYHNNIQSAAASLLSFFPFLIPVPIYSSYSSYDVALLVLTSLLHVNCWLYRWTFMCVVFTSQTLTSATWRTMVAVYTSAPIYQAIIAALVMMDSIWLMMDITAWVRSDEQHSDVMDQLWW